jgi:hypothetical protein
MYASRMGVKTYPKQDSFGGHTTLWLTVARSRLRGLDAGGGIGFVGEIVTVCGASEGLETRKDGLMVSEMKIVGSCWLWSRYFGRLQVNCEGGELYSTHT